MKAVIMAGGRGTRISSLFSDIPKPMIKIDNVPILEYELLNLKKENIIDIIITVCYKSEVIINYFGDGSKWGLNIEYYIEKEPLGNAGALFEIKDKLTDDFLLLNADSMFDINFEKFIEYHEFKKSLVTILTHPNNHPYDSGLIITDERNRVTNWISKEENRPTYYKNRVNAGIHIISPKILEKRPNKQKIDLDRDILKPLVSSGCIFAYDSSEYVKDMGTPDRFMTVCEDIKKNKVKAKNLLYKQKAIFLDRDGTINKYKGFLTKIEEFELIDGVSKAINKINNSGYLTIVITNQPVIARGDISYEKLNSIHDKMETLLGEKGAYLDAIYVCPHHPDSGYKGEVKELKIICDCRKPKPGLILKAAKDFNVDLNNSWMIGDSKNDILAGKNAGCKTALIGKEDYGQELTVSSLSDFIERVNLDE